MIDNPDLDFSEAKDHAKQKAKEACADPMLMSWYRSKTGESYPNLECGPGDKPAWIVYAELRGGDQPFQGSTFTFSYSQLAWQLKHEAFWDPFCDLRPAS